jgi:O-Antigen ligase
MQIVLFLLLFVFALNIPLISFFSIVAAFFLIFFKGVSLENRYKSSVFFSKEFIVSYLILFIFSITYFLTISSYNLADDDILRTILLINISYIIGYSIKLDTKIDNTLSYICIYLALIGGGVLFVLLCIKNSSTFDVVGRSVPNIWKSGEANVNGTLMDLYSMLGTGLLPFIFYRKNLKLHPGNYNLTIFTACAIGFTSLFTTIILQGRKAILSLAIAFVLTIIYKITNLKSTNNRILYIVLLSIGSLFLVIYSGNIFEFLTQNFGVFARFNDEGLESGRYQIWADILESMPTHLFGGRSFPISENFAHNIWLDVFYDGGLLPMLLLLAFHALHIKSVFKIIRSKLPESIIILIICSIVPIFMGFQGEPVLQASIFYFSITCCLFGMILQLSQATDEYLIIADDTKEEND